MTHWRRGNDDNVSRDVDSRTGARNGPVDLDAYRVSRGGCAPHSPQLRGVSKSEGCIHLREEPVARSALTPSKLASALTYVGAVVFLLWMVLHR